MTRFLNPLLDRATGGEAALIASLAAYYAMDGAAGDDEVDSHGNAGDLVATNSPPSVAGVVSTARYVQATDGGTDRYFNLASTHALQFTGSFSVCGFVEVTDYSEGSAQYVYIAGCGGYNGGYNIKVTNNQRAAFIVNGPTVSSVTLHAIIKDVGEGYCFFAFVHDEPNKSIYGYSDRTGSLALEDSDTYSGWDYQQPNNDALKVGQGQNISDTAAQYLDALTFFNKALTLDEITWIYNSGAGRAYSEY